MSYNPTIGSNKRNSVRVPPAGSGTKRSDIRKRAAITNNIIPGVLFDGDEFAVNLVSLKPGNSIGFGVNQKGDRFVKVLRGTLFTFNDVSGTRVVKTLIQGGFLAAPKNTPHGYASSGTDSVDILVVESKNYSKTWKVIDPPTESLDRGEPVLETSAVRAAREALLKGEEPLVKRKGRSNKEQALKIAKDREQNKKASIARAEARSAYDNPNSTSSVGKVAPRGPAGWNED